MVVVCRGAWPVRPLSPIAGVTGLFGEVLAELVAELACVPGRTVGRSAPPAGDRGRCPASAGVPRPGTATLVHLRPAPRSHPRRVGLLVRGLTLDDHPSDREQAMSDYQ